MAYKSFTKLTVYSSTGCPPVSLSVTVTCTSLSDNALVVTVPITGAVYRERECYIHYGRTLHSVQLLSLITLHSRMSLVLNVPTADGPC